METLKKSIFQFHYHKFSQQRNSIVSYCNRRVIRKGGEESDLILGKSALVLVISIGHLIKFLIKNCIFVGGKTQNFSLFSLSFLCFDEYQSAIIPRKFPCPGNALLMGLYHNAYLRKSTLKNHENVKCLDFQFHSLKFSQESYFGPFLILQLLIYL